MATNDLKLLKENASGGTDEVPAAQASSSDLDTGTEVGKIVTPKSLKDSKYQLIHVGTTAPTDLTMLWLDTN